MTVASILAQKSKKLICVSPDTPVSDVTRILHEQQIGAVLVTEGDTLLGVLTERGIVRAMALNPQGVRAMRADAVMRPKQHEAHLSSTLDEAMQIMTENRVRYLPVCEDGRLIGLVSIGDVVKAEVVRNAQEVQNLTAYISGGQ